MKDIRTTLSCRERQIAKLKTMGMTNREIAHELAIGERTVQGNIQHIYRKPKVFNTLTLQDAVVA